MPAHLGTTDVDMLLTMSTGLEEHAEELEAALLALGFAATKADGGWRWHSRVDGRRMVMEFLCDTDVREFEVVRLPACAYLGALNLRGTGFVRSDWSWQQVTSDLPDLGRTTVDVRFAGLAGYLLSKCVAVRTRSAEKDHYDLPYVLIYNKEGGPAAAAEYLRASPLSSSIGSLRSTLIEVRERYATVTRRGPADYAEQMRLVEPEADERLLRAAAVAAVSEFTGSLLDHGR